MTSSLLLLLILTWTTTTTTALSETTASPPGPTNITKILEKAGQYNILLNLLRITQIDDQINNQLASSDKQGFTVFAPTDDAFSALSLNSLSDPQKLQLVKFHVISTYLSTSHFETISNPVTTQAGEATYYKFPLNITTSGSHVNITTGVVNATVGNTIYSDGSLAVYQVDKVLLPMSMFGPPAPAAAPAPAPEPLKTKDKSNADAVTPSSQAQGGSTVSADAVGFRGHLHGFIMGAIVFIGMSCL